MSKILNSILGDLDQKKRYRTIEKRSRSLPTEYTEAYQNIKQYLWHTSGVYTLEPLASLVDMLEEAAADDKRVIDITGPDVASFADELVRGEISYKEQQREKLNKKLNKKS